MEVPATLQEGTLENARLQAEKQRLLDRLALYTGPLPPAADTVQRLFAVFTKNQSGEIDAGGFRQLAWVLGEDLSDAEAHTCVARLDLDRSGGLSLPELQAWWASHDKGSGGDSSSSSSEDNGQDSVLPVLLRKLRSTSYVQMLMGWRERWKKNAQERHQHVDDHIFRCTVDAAVGEFGEARSSVSAHFTHDADAAAAARRELKAPPNCVAITSVAFTIRGDVDEFELGELAGSVANLLLLAKPVLRFHSHKMQMGRHKDERVMVLSLFWDDIDELTPVRSGLIGADIQQIDGTIELSQQPGDQTEEFVRGRVKGKLAMGVNVVPFLNELFWRYKGDGFKAKANLLAAFRDLDLTLRTERVDEAYRRFAARIDLLRDVRGLASLKQLILPVLVSLYNDNSVPTPIKDTYFVALATLRGVASLHLQMDDQALRFTFDNAGVAVLLPTKEELSTWKAPVSVVAPPRNLRPLFGSHEFRVAVAGPPKVGKSSIVMQYTQNYFPAVMLWEDVYVGSPSLPEYGLAECADVTVSSLAHNRKYVTVDDSPLALDVTDTPSDALQINQWLPPMDAVVLVYSVTDRASFEAMEELRKRVLNVKTVPIILLGNKEDQGDQRKVTPEEGAELAATWNDAVFFEVSARDNLNLEEAFTELVHEIRSLEEEEDSMDWYSAV